MLISPSLFPIPGDSVQVFVQNGGFGGDLSGDRWVRVRMVSPYGILLDIRTRGWDTSGGATYADMYAGKVKRIISTSIVFYPWTNVLSVKPAPAPEWAELPDGEYESGVKPPTLEEWQKGLPQERSNG